MFGPLFSPLLGDYTDTLWFPKQASNFAAEVDSTYMLILWISLVFFVVIVWALVWFSYKYKQPKGGKATSRVRHNNVLEISWSVFPSFLLVVMFVKGSWGYLDMREIPAGATEIGVTAASWSWSFDYGDGITHPELHVVKGEPTKLIMESSDVIHSLFVPAFRVKRDVVPGRYNYLWFTPTVANERVSKERLDAAKAVAKAENEGVFDAEKNQFTLEGYEFFDLYCSEYCGKDHSEMQTMVVVHDTREDLEAWLQEINVKPEGMSDEEYGRLQYSQQGCVSCHTLDGKAGTGPSFQGLWGRQEKLTTGDTVLVDENYVRESILDPMAKIVDGYQPVMQSYKGRLTEDKLRSLIAFIKSLE